MPVKSKPGYARHAELVKETAARFVRKYKGDADEVFADACLHFVEACGEWRRHRGPFRRYAKWQMWMGLLARKRTEARRARLVPRVELADVPGTDGPPAVLEVLESLSEDGKQVVWLALYPPPDVRFAVNERGGPHAPRNWRSAIQEHLRAVGWTGGRVARGMREVRAAFGGD